MTLDHQSVIESIEISVYYLVYHMSQKNLHHIANHEKVK